jgi:hypothetical protein
MIIASSQELKTRLKRIIIPNTKAIIELTILFFIVYGNFIILTIFNKKLDHRKKVRFPLIQLLSSRNHQFVYSKQKEAAAIN